MYSLTTRVFVYSLKTGWTPLMYAVANAQSLAVVEALMAGKADLEAKNTVRDLVNDISLGLSEATLLPFYPFTPNLKP